jgi:hypothetical protein
MTLFGSQQDLVLGPEPGQRRDAGQGDGADDERPERDRHVFLQAAHLAHVVGVHGVDDRAGAEEQQGFEGGVGEEVEHARRPRPHPEGRDHVAQLGDGGVGEDPFDVVLDEGQTGGDEHGDTGDESDEVEAAGFDGEALPEDAVHAGHEIDPGHHHGGGVDQGGDRGGAGHGVREPDVEGELRALAHDPQEEEAAADEDEGVGHLVFEGHPVDDFDVEVLPGGEEQRDDAQHEADVTRSGGEERLEGGGGVGFLLVPVADELEGAEPDQLPADQELEQVVGHDHEQHGGGEQRQGGEEVGEADVAVHVAH